MKGRFITVDGIEGGGKTTQLAFIKEYLENKGYSVVATREPGGTSLGEDIRALVLNHRRESIAVDSELLLMFAARAEHIHKVILPALERGQWVICDRFTDATYAYQGGGQGVPMERIRILENWVQNTLRPDLTLIFDLPVEIGLTRVTRRAPKDRFEALEREFFQRVRDVYRDLVDHSPERYRLISAAQSVEKVRAEVQAALDSLRKWDE